MDDFDFILEQERVFEQELDSDIGLFFNQRDEKPNRQPKKAVNRGSYFTINNVDKSNIIISVYTNKGVKINKALRINQTNEFADEVSINSEEFKVFFAKECLDNSPIYLLGKSNNQYWVSDIFYLTTGNKKDLSKVFKTKVDETKLEKILPVAINEKNINNILPKKKYFT